MTDDDDSQWAIWGEAPGGDFHKRLMVRRALVAAGVPAGFLPNDAWFWKRLDYLTSPHNGLGGLSPIEAWLAGGVTDARNVIAEFDSSSPAF